tara:strand:- start:3381 stop:3977 length:597 start_codon:yes stop_codon:yes gene_type:complete
MNNLFELHISKFKNKKYKWIFNINKFNYFINYLFNEDNNSSFIIEDNKYDSLIKNDIKIKFMLSKKLYMLTFILTEYLNMYIYNLNTPYYVLPFYKEDYENIKNLYKDKINTNFIYYLDKYYNLNNIKDLNDIRSSIYSNNILDILKKINLKKLKITINVLIELLKNMFCKILNINENNLLNYIKNLKYDENMITNIF